MCAEFARLGHVVLGCGRSRDAIAELAREYAPPGAMRKSNSSPPDLLQHDFAALDVASDSEVAAWAQRVIASHGAPDLVLNNAALINRTAPLWRVPAREFSDVVDVNVKGVANVIRHFVPSMIAAERGVVVNFSSGWGRSTDAGVAPYCATKFAVEGLSRALAQDLPRGLACIPLSPGVVDTDMLKSAMGDASSNCISPAAWAKKCVPYILTLGPQHNGKSLTTP